MRKLRQLFMLGLFGMISIGANAEDIPNNVIWYEASAKLTETTDDYDSGLHTNAFNLRIESHEFINGRGRITFNDKVTSIGNFAFLGCSGLTSVTIPNSVTSIGSYAFENCSGLTSVTIPNSVKMIGVVAFAGCSRLTSVTIPNSVTEIGDWAFNGCSGLTSVTIGNSVSEIGYDAFNGCSGLTSIIVGSDNAVYDSRDNCNAIIETASNKLIFGCRNTIIPNSVTEIGEYAFSRCSGLTSVIIPNSVIKIGDYAFFYCSGLTSVTIGNSVTSIGNSAFNDCSGLTSVYVEWEEDSNIPSIESSTFPYSQCTLYVPHGTRELYLAKEYWWTFKLIIGGLIIEDKDGKETSVYITDSDPSLALSDDINSIKNSGTVKNVNITYTRNFDKAGVWQAWYMPFDVAFDDMKDAYDVAQIHGVLLDKDNNAVLAFLKLDNGTVKANTPYVVRPKASGEVSIETTTDLQSTVSKSFDLKSATDIYYLGGVYEKTTTPGNWYALNLDGQFQLMGSGVYLRPFRIYMTIDPRDDNPYATSVNANAKMDIVVIGDDETTGITSYENDNDNENLKAMTKGEGAIYNLSGLRVNSIQKGQIYIMNGKKYIAK